MAVLRPLAPLQVSLLEQCDAADALNFPGEMIGRGEAVHAGADR